MEEMGTFPNEMIHITLGCIVHLHGHQNKMVLVMKPSILTNFSNGAKFHNHHIDNENLVLLGHVKINL
jgi:hypothetical protein